RPEPGAGAGPADHGRGAGGAEGARAAGRAAPRAPGGAGTAGGRRRGRPPGRAGGDAHARADGGPPPGGGGAGRGARADRPQDKPRRAALLTSERNRMSDIPAIDAWCNAFDERGIREIFLDNEEVRFMMGDRWGRAGNMVAYTPAEFVARLDELNVRTVMVPSLKQAYYRRRAMAVDMPHEHVAQLAESHPGRIV